MEAQLMDKRRTKHFNLLVNWTKQVNIGELNHQYYVISKVSNGGGSSTQLECTHYDIIIIIMRDSEEEYCITTQVAIVLNEQRYVIKNHADNMIMTMIIVTMLQLTRGRGYRRN